jgi:hypothetical protein
MGVFANGFNMKQGTAVATVSGTAVDFVNIPAWAKRITITISGLSTNYPTTTGTSITGIQIGSGSIDATGYQGELFVGNAAGDTHQNFSTMFIFFSSLAAADLRHGEIVLTNLSGNLWAVAGNICLSNSPIAAVLAGSKSLSGVLDRIRITTNGTDLFDAGTANIIWEG